jgi:lipoprotein-anchoring transpeptidase ErfK/SrfK
MNGTLSRTFEARTYRPARSNQQRQPAMLLLALLFLLANCGPSSQAHKTGSVTPPPTPSISVSLKQQGAIQLQTYAQWIQLLQQSGGTAQFYQQQYTTDEQALTKATAPNAYTHTLSQLQTHVAAIQLPAIKTEAQQFQQQFQQQVHNWGEAHTFYNAYDATTYPLGYEYAANGIGGWIQDDLASAQTLADYQQEIENMSVYRTNFQAMKANATDKTPYNQPHQTDLSLLDHYQQNGKALVISLKEQTMRVYNQKKLVNAFYVTTGRPDLPTPPGVWWIEGKQSPTVFKAGVPPGSPDWYPDTPIQYAMQYHSNGYYIHDSWWRNDYGPGTNYPHVDSSGDSFSAQGSHGCVNVSSGNAAWLYNFVEINTRVIIY